MALQGTIKDFGLADIFQLIGIQRKTGILTLENDTERVTVKFLEGKVAGADTRERKLEDQLGAVLVRTGRITEVQLQEALQTQKNTLQRLGYIMVHAGFIAEADLRDALRIQVSHIVYRLFRWRDGRYHFDTKDEIDYDKDHFDPINSETILMEGARMIDEWPIIERRIKSPKLVFRKTEAGESIEAPVESLVDEDVDFDFGFDGGESQEEKGESGEIKLTAEEQQVLRVVDGRSTIQELVDRLALAEFDVYRSLYELSTRSLIEEVQRSPAVVGPKAGTSAKNLLGRFVMVILMGFSFLAMATLDSNPATPWKVGGKDGVTDLLRTYSSRVRLERIERAIRIFYFDTGAVPDRLELLAQNGYLDRRDLADPWGRAYGFQLSEGSFMLIGRDASGAPTGDLTVSRKFSAAQRLLLDGAASAP